MKKPFIFGFEIIRPRFNFKQEELMRWMSEAHAMVEQLENRPLSVIQGRQTSNLEMSAPAVTATLKKDAEYFHSRFKRFGCAPEQIQFRGSELEDFTHLNWEKMEVYNLDRSKRGGGFRQRMQAYSKSVGRIFSEFYQKVATPPEQIIHVSCTGYESPSAVQRLISQKQWGQDTSSVHAYHMGCYAAFPAMNLGSNRLARQGGERAVDVVHTEFCTLHLQTAAQTADQYVIQSLFADGFIKYSMINEDAPSVQQTPGLVVEGFLERLVKDSSHAMTWVCSDHGLEMTLDRDVPGMIADEIERYCEDLAASVNMTFTELRQKALFAVHPGGPKIITAVQDLLKLEDHRLAHSRDVLKRYGNMSSATVPHILESIVRDAKVPAGTPVVSMAFGPGLTIYGAVFVKR